MVLSSVNLHFREGGALMNRSFTARLSARTPRRLRDYLWATHRLLNESLAYLVKQYFSMQKNRSSRKSRQ
jgi:hypothetical protein